MSQASTIVFNAADAKSIIILINHLNMIKFASRKNERYEKMSRHLQLLTEETLNAVSAR